MSNNQKFIGALCAIGATAIWSGNFIVARELNETVPPVSLAFWRWVVAVIAFLPLALKPMLSQRKLIKDHFLYLLATAFLGVTAFNTLIYIAGHTTTALNLSLIAITFPVFIIVLSRIFLNELITGVKIVGVGLVVLGVVFLLTKGNLSVLKSISFTTGDLWMLLASSIFAIYSMLLKKKPETMSIWTLQLSTFLIGLILLAPFFLYERSISAPVEFDIKSVLSILYVGVFASLTAFLLWNKAIEIVGPSTAAMIYYTLPLFSGVLAFFFLGEVITMTHLYSALCIVSGILIASYRKKAKSLE